MDFYRGSENLLAKREGAFLFGESLQVEFNGLADVGNRLLQARPLRLTAFELGAPSVIPVFVLFDYYAGFAGHVNIVAREA